MFEPKQSKVTINLEEALTVSELDRFARDAEWMGHSLEAHAIWIITGNQRAHLAQLKRRGESLAIRKKDGRNDLY